MVFLKALFEKVKIYFEKFKQTTKKQAKITQHAVLEFRKVLQICLLLQP